MAMATAVGEPALVIDPFRRDPYELSTIPIDLPLPADEDLDFEEFDFDSEFNFDDFIVCGPDEAADASVIANGFLDPMAASSSSNSSTLQSASPDSDQSASQSPDLNVETTNPESGLKRKIENDDEKTARSGLSNRKSSKSRRTEDGTSSDVLSPENDMEEKRCARLKRNRESAQLSRQRKKHYVEELEEKLRSMNSTISELNGKISFIMAENASLRQQLSGGGKISAPSQGIYPPAPPVPFPWIPRYTIGPQGSQVPLLPIPRWKPQQPAPSPKPKKPMRSKAAEGKTKKLASISLLGLLFILLFASVVIPGVNFRYGVIDKRSGVNDRVPGEESKVFGVNGHANRYNNSTDGIVPYHGAVNVAEDSFASTHNYSDSLPALLYVPKNGKHMKINGNLILNSVLASERSIEKASSAAQSGDVEGFFDNDVNRTGLVMTGKLASALAVKDGIEVGGLPSGYRNPEGHNTGSGSSSKVLYGDPLRSTPAEGRLQQWFLEGMAGPILNSGMCTEVFQFEVSPTVDPTGIGPAVNTTDEKKLPLKKLRNRRILSSSDHPILLSGVGSLNVTEGLENLPNKSSNLTDKKSSSSSIVVSVLADPREAGDGDSDGMISPKKSLSRIFVVVLFDSVKYVTYSCVLPLRSSGPHLVN